MGRIVVARSAKQSVNQDKAAFDALIIMMVKTWIGCFLVPYSGIGQESDEDRGGIEEGSDKDQAVM